MKILQTEVNLLICYINRQTYWNETLGRPRCIWEEIITMDLKEVGDSTRNRVDYAEEIEYSRALVNAAVHLRVP